MNKKILICFGTRPEAIKMCSLVHLLKKSDFDCKVCVTAQHREMLDQVLEFFEIVPDFDLNIMKPNQSLNQLSGNIFLNLENVLSSFNPDLVLVHGDTTTSSIVAWAAFNHRIRVGHVEAGLRTFDKKNPFPEELNRQITGRIADFHFAPTTASQRNLIKENIKEQNILVTGNTVIDSLLWTKSKLDNGFTNKNIKELKNLINPSKKTILVTSHRRENFGQGFIDICHALREIAKDENVEIIFPVHLNPNVRKPIFELLSHNSNIHLIEPLDYPSFVWLMKQSYFIITDSGGIQEEAPSLGKPVLVMRETTERPEAVKANTVVLLGTNTNKIVNFARILLEDKSAYKKMAQSYNPYGDGHANKKIIKYLNINL
ncbi:non-hydrolyzing UDP-N-acetylglucosamine 2-epimerase [Croceibacter atlanticus]|uniref:non-hydrolyzing UDP-N-acetylglucosamine 2-epimerase n=1 Tax=Croceibacter atlanticus TaxID=313588 RepID=UPI0030D85B0C|tara:strand:- start:88868 stop:89986 length:1119 start_codon:yes stop_codon:yes gene_type:complete